MSVPTAVLVLGRDGAMPEGHDHESTVYTDVASAFEGPVPVDDEEAPIEFLDAVLVDVGTVAEYKYVRGVAAAIVGESVRGTDSRCDGLRDADSA
jgi:hypothetical protein